MTESAFSSSAQAVIQRPVALDKSETHTQLPAEQFRDYYELEWTANEIISKNYTRVSSPPFHLDVIMMNRTPLQGCPPISG
jgi:hypothetical protein